MSLATFFAHLWQSIKSLFDKLPSATKTAVSIGYTSVNALKSITDLDQADLIGSVFGQFGKSVEDNVRSALPDILIQLQLVKNAADTNDPNQIVAAALQTIQSLDPNFQAAFWHDLAVYIAQLVSDGNLSWSDGVLILQWYHDHKKVDEAQQP